MHDAILAMIEKRGSLGTRSNGTAPSAKSCRKPPSRGSRGARRGGELEAGGGGCPALRQRSAVDRALGGAVVQGCGGEDRVGHMMHGWSVRATFS